MSSSEEVPTIIVDGNSSGRMIYNQQLIRARVGESESSPSIAALKHAMQTQQSLPDETSSESPNVIRRSGQHQPQGSLLRLSLGSSLQSYAAQTNSSSLSVPINSGSPLFTLQSSSTDKGGLQLSSRGMQRTNSKGGNQMKMITTPRKESSMLPSLQQANRSNSNSPSSMKTPSSAAAVCTSSTSSQQKLSAHGQRAKMLSQQSPSISGNLGSTIAAATPSQIPLKCAKTLSFSNANRRTPSKSGGHFVPATGNLPLSGNPPQLNAIVASPQPSSPANFHIKMMAQPNNNSSSKSIGQELVNAQLSNRSSAGIKQVQQLKIDLTLPKRSLSTSTIKPPQQLYLETTTQSNFTSQQFDNNATSVGKILQQQQQLQQSQSVSPQGSSNNANNLARQGVKKHSETTIKRSQFSYQAIKDQHEKQQHQQYSSSSTYIHSGRHLSEVKKTMPTQQAVVEVLEVVADINGSQQQKKKKHEVFTFLQCDETI